MKPGAKMLMANITFKNQKGRQLEQHYKGTIIGQMPLRTR